MAWMIYAKRPLYSAEIEHSIAMDLHSRDFDMDDIIPAQKLEDLCCGLVAIDISKRFRFVHPTVQDHILMILPEKLANAELLVAKKCMSYLQLRHLDDGPCETAEKVETRLTKYPLLRYCSHHWAQHLRNLEDQEMEKLAMTFVNKQIYWQSCHQILEYCLTSKLIEIPGTGLSPLIISAMIGQLPVVRALLTVKGININFQSLPWGQTALMIAIKTGWVDIALLLLKEDSIDVNLACNCDHEPVRQGWTAICFAIETGNETLVDALLEKGASTHFHTDAGDTALLLAARANRTYILARILQSQDGASPQLQGKWLDSRTRHIRRAAGSFCQPYSLDTATRRERSTALHLAVLWGNEQIAELLIQHGASLDFPNKENNLTVVECALYWNNLEILEIFSEVEPEHPLLLARGLTKDSR
jgi:hypothetical protein